ncbi:hypothetical protein [Cryptosporangium minutisporangium]|uniref:hypothetical protein n=1 Tax=Cryptosporangium minutisporangium TaxID=113569 RepID=UPI0031E5F5AC
MPRVPTDPADVLEHLPDRPRGSTGSIPAVPGRLPGGPIRSPQQAWQDIQQAWRDGASGNFTEACAQATNTQAPQSDDDDVDPMFRICQRITRGGTPQDYTCAVIGVGGGVVGGIFQAPRAGATASEGTCRVWNGRATSEEVACDTAAAGAQDATQSQTAGAAVGGACEVVTGQTTWEGAACKVAVAGMSETGAERQHIRAVQSSCGVLAQGGTTAEAACAAIAEEVAGERGRARGDRAGDICRQAVAGQPLNQTTCDEVRTEVATRGDVTDADRARQLCMDIATFMSRSGIQR